MKCFTFERKAACARQLFTEIENCSLDPSFFLVAGLVVAIRRRRLLHFHYSRTAYRVFGTREILCFLIFRSFFFCCLCWCLCCWFSGCCCNCCVFWFVLRLRRWCDSNCCRGYWTNWPSCDERNFRSSRTYSSEGLAVIEGRREKGEGRRARAKGEGRRAKLAKG